VKAARVVVAIAAVVWSVSYVLHGETWRLGVAISFTLAWLGLALMKGSR